MHKHVRYHINKEASERSESTGVSLEQVFSLHEPCQTLEGEQPQRSLCGEAHKDLCNINTLEHVLPVTKMLVPIWSLRFVICFLHKNILEKKIGFRNIFAWKICYRCWGRCVFPPFLWLHWIHVMSRNSNQRCGLGDCSRLWVTGTSCTNARAKADHCDHSGEPCLLCLLSTPRGPDSALALLPTNLADVACYCNSPYISQRD